MPEVLKISKSNATRCACLTPSINSPVSSINLTQTPQGAASLGRVNVLTAYSASQRKDAETGHKNCNAAIEIADSFSKDTRYKTRIVAARTYVTAGRYLLIELHDAMLSPR